MNWRIFHSTSSGRNGQILSCGKSPEKIAMLYHCYESSDFNSKANSYAGRENLTVSSSMSKQKIWRLILYPDLLRPVQVIERSGYAITRRHHISWLAVFGLASPLSNHYKSFVSQKQFEWLWFLNKRFELSLLVIVLARPRLLSPRGTLETVVPLSRISMCFPNAYYPIYVVVHR